MIGLHVAVLAKAPVPGRVKTRLQPPLNARQAAAAYEASLHDVLELVAALGAPTVIHHDPAAESEAYFACRFDRYQRLPQVEGHLGERMSAAFDRGFTDGATALILLGADSPTLPLAALHLARDSLADHDIVLGPADDGGYYLVGIRSDAWPRATSIFENVEWSTPAVLEQTLRIAGRLGLDVATGMQWYDIDRIADLERARLDARPDSHLARWFAADRALDSGGSASD